MTNNNFKASITNFLSLFKSKKKILLISLMVAMLVCLFAISVSAYTPATSYNYYVDSMAEENLVYSATTKMDPSRGRYEMTVTESGEGFAKFDENGNALTWYVIEESTDENGARHIVCKAVKTIGEAGTVDEKGHYTYGGGSVAAVTNKNVVSVCFYGTGVKTLPDNVYQCVAPNPPSGSNGEYNVFASDTYLMFLYLPKTLTEFPAYMCQRSSVRVVEFEDNQIAATEIVGAQSGGNSPFAFCGNLKAISIPDGVTRIAAHAFNGCSALAKVEFPDSVKEIGSSAFRNCDSLKSVEIPRGATVDERAFKESPTDIKYK